MNLIMKLLILSKNKIKKGILTIAKEVWIDGVNDTTNTDIFTFTVNGETITASVLNPGTIELEEGVYEVVETDYGDYIPDDNTLEAIVVKQGALVKFVNRFTTPLPTLYQEWDGYPNTPDLTEDYPYQFIGREYAQTYLNLSTEPIYYHSTGKFRGGTRLRYQLVNGEWSNMTVPTYFYAHELYESNYDIYDDITYSTIYYSKTTSI